ncbi:MAG TPA: 3-dehydroquinate dehydratase [Actinomycetales bacterium]|nr:3-dehydroquinate dehydratase [Actinomycetales bacterium]
MARILLLNGPNLGRLGQRNVEIYGTTTLAEVVDMCRTRAGEGSWQVADLQTNHEGDVIDRLEQRDYDAVLINPGAWSHYSYALRDALEACDVPIAEVHISAVEEREAFRHTDVIAEVCQFRVSGHGVAGYVEAVDWILETVGPRQTR